MRDYKVPFALGLTVFFLGCILTAISSEKAAKALVFVTGVLVIVIWLWLGWEGYV